MDANRYFEEMHRAMSAQKSDYSLILSVKVQDLGGADAYLELRRQRLRPRAGLLLYHGSSATSTFSCSARAGSSATTLPAN